jgi:hypothetical protein
LLTDFVCLPNLRLGLARNVDVLETFAITTRLI